MDNKNLTFGYLGAMAVALIAVFMPWASISFNVPDLPAAIGGGATANGMHCLQGVMTLLCSLAGGVLCAIGAYKFLGGKTKFVMAGIGAAIAGWAVINFLVVHNNSDVKAMAAIVGDKISIGAGLGTWLALIAGIAGAALAWMVDWSAAPVLFNTGGAVPQGFPVVTTPAATTPPAAAAPVPPAVEQPSSQTTA